MCTTNTRLYIPDFVFYLCRILKPLVHMSITLSTLPPIALVHMGIKNRDKVRYQLTPEELVQDSLRLNEGELNDTGALVIKTGEFTGRSPKDKFIVKDALTENTVDWNDFNIAIDGKYFDIVYNKIIDHLNQLPEIWVRDCYACADPRYRLNIRVINEKPWNN